MYSQKENGECLNVRKISNFGVNYKPRIQMANWAMWHNHEENYNKPQEIKLLKPFHTEKILKTYRKKQTPFKEWNEHWLLMGEKSKPIKPKATLIASLSAERNNGQIGILHQAKITYKTERRIKAFFRKTLTDTLLSQPICI